MSVRIKEILIPVEGTLAAMETIMGSPLFSDQIRQSNTTWSNDFMIRLGQIGNFGAVPLIRDESVPDDIVRVVYTDGSTWEIDITEAKWVIVCDSCGEIMDKSDDSRHACT